MVFLASAITLIIEIIAARILAPHIGVSVYTWTSIIGIILAGISFGNWLGGVIADRAASKGLLGLILMAGAAFTLLILPLAQIAPRWVLDLPILWRIVSLTAILFIVPATILAMVTPTVITLTLRDLSKTGKTVGRIYALSTAGAIVGVFLTGFLLIQWLGSRETILYLAITLAIIAIVSGRLWRSAALILAPILVVGMFLAAGYDVNSRPLLQSLSIPLLSLVVTLPLMIKFIGRPTMRDIVITALILGAGMYSWTGQPLKSSCIRESNYFCIKLIEHTLDNGDRVRLLALDQLAHSFVKMGDPTHLEYEYQQILAEVLETLAPENPDMRALFIGGGGYELPRYMEVSYPESILEVIEIDPAVTEVAFDYLDLNRATRVSSINEDARMVIPRLEKGSYHIVFGDAFNDVSVPYHLTTLEFSLQVRDLLKEDGVYTVNVVDAPKSGRFLRSLVKTLRQSFPHVQILNDAGDLELDQQTTTIVIASLRGISAGDLEQAVSRIGKDEPEGLLISSSAIDRWLLEGESIVLRDDFVPVDNFLAPLYLESR